MTSRPPKPKYEGELATPIEINRLSEFVREQFSREGREWEQKAFEVATAVEQGKKLSILARHYGLTLSSGLNPIDPEKLKLLLLRLAQDHVRGFKIALKIGAPEKISPTEEEFLIYHKINDLMSKRGLTAVGASHHVADHFPTKGRNKKVRSMESVRAIHKRVGQFFGQNKK